MNKNIRKTIALAVTTFFLYFIYSRIDLQVFYNNIVNMNRTYLLWAFLLFPVIPLIKTCRWKIILGSKIDIPYFVALKVLMAGSVFNLFVPSKLGDFSRIYFGRKELGIGRKRIFNSVIAEKVCDSLTLCFISLISVYFVDVNPGIRNSILLFSSVILFFFFFILNQNFHEISFLKYYFQKFKLIEIVNDAKSLLDDIKCDKVYFIKIFLVSVFYWYIILFQIYLFFLIFNLKVSVLLVIGLVPVALFIGMIPITVSGIGTRDAALIFIFSQYYSPEIMAGIGILCSSRYLVGCLLGLPFFLQHYLSENKIQELRTEN